MSAHLEPGALHGLQQPASFNQFAQRLVDDFAVVEQASLFAVDVARGEAVSAAQVVKLTTADAFGQRGGGL